MGKVIAVCTSDVKGIQKSNVERAYLKKDFGLQDDAHGGTWHRQVSLLSYDKVTNFNKQGAGVNHGDFGENLLVEGIDFKTLPVGTLLKCGEGLIEITQIGKECHTRCQIYHKMGDCIMPREGVFAKVIEEGYVAVGDILEIIEPEKNAAITAAVVTLSDKGSKGERADESGEVIKEILTKAGYIVKDKIILPDEQRQIEETLITLSDRRGIKLIITTGGTGFSKRDITPEATLAVAEKVAPGVAEAIRANSLKITDRAMLSRAVAVIRGDSIIINLPGSPKAVKESLEYILPHIEHGLEILSGEAKECARQ